MRSVPPSLWFAFLIVLAFSLGTEVYLRALQRAEGAPPDEGVFNKLVGDGRRLFAGQFVEMADVYFHSGLYPSIFDRTAAKATKAVTGAVGRDAEQHLSQGAHHHDGHGEEEHDDEEAEHAKAMTPTASNWLERFIQRFRITQHSHLSNGNEREILPWLKMAIELDPQAIETYTTAAYWLRKSLGQADEAELVLREGLRNNPTNHVLLFELGLLYKESRHDNAQARNLWLAALKCWQRQGEAARKDDGRMLSNIASHLGQLEEEEGNYAQALKAFELAKPHSPNPEAIQGWIDRIRSELNSPAKPPSTR